MHVNTGITANRPPDLSAAQESQDTERKSPAQGHIVRTKAMRETPSLRPPPPSPANIHLFISIFSQLLYTQRKKFPKSNLCIREHLRVFFLTKISKSYTRNSPALFLSLNHSSWGSSSSGVSLREEPQFSYPAPTVPLPLISLL